MRAKGHGTTLRARRARIAVALCMASLAASAFGGDLTGAVAKPRPTGSYVRAADVGEDPAPTSDGDTSTTTTTEPTETTTTTTPDEPPADTTTTPDAPTATTPAPASAGPAPAPAQATTVRPPVAAPAHKPAAPATSTPFYLPLPLGQLDDPVTAATGRCIASVSQVTPDQLLGADCQPLPSEPTIGMTAGGGQRGSIDQATLDGLRTKLGLPTLADPTTSVAIPGAAPIGVPNFFIDKFRIPVFLLPIYQAAGIQYGVRWEVLAAINEIETDYGRNLNVSSAGALGWMQFMPATWKRYGVDANRDGKKDPFNPVDAIFAAARYLKAAGAGQDLRKAIFSYNHADWYVESVLMRARLIGGLPSDLIGSLSGLTEGHFPVYAKARYADDLSEHRATRRAAADHNAAMPVDSDSTRRGIDIFAAPGSPVIAVQDGRIVSTGDNARLGRYVILADAYGNTYTYANLKKVAARVAVAKNETQSKASVERELAPPTADPKPTQAASAGRPTHTRPALTAAASSATTEPAPVAAPATAAALRKERLFAHPARVHALRNGGARQLAEQESSIAAGQTLKSYVMGSSGLDQRAIALKPLVAGQRVVAGSVLGRIGTLSKRVSPHMHFEIRPAGRGAPRIDPKPILDGWKLLEATAIYRARGENALVGAASSSSVGQVMLMSKEALTTRVLADPRIAIYACGRRDIEAGAIDRRVLATLEFLASSGLKPTVTSLHCGHSMYTTSGNLSEHSAGSAVDIAQINGIPILGHQGPGSITDITIRRLLTLQGTMKPHQIISLMTFPDADNTLALPDHADHIHIGFAPQYAPGTPQAKELASVLKPSQWVKLIDRLGTIANPTVATTPSKYAIPAPVTRASVAHEGE